MKKWKIYVLINKKNGKKYIGTTSQSVSKRWCSGANYRNQPFGKEIEKYGWDNFEHFVLIDNLDECTAFEVEKELIKKYRTNDKQYGYNISSGGKGCALSPTSETRKKLSDANKGKNAKTVYQYSLDGKFIKEWNSTPEIKEILGFKKWGILSCCSGKQNKAYGYIWLHEKNDKEALRRTLCRRENLDKEKVNKIRYDYETKNKTFLELASEYGLTTKIISNIVKNKTYFAKNVCQ